MRVIYFSFEQLKSKVLLLTLVLFSFLVQPAMASHTVGSDVTYQCTGTTGVYQVTMKIYRDCAGVQLCSNCPTALSPACSIPISIVGAAGSCTGTNFGSQSISVITAVSGFDVVQLCAATTSICSNCGTRTPGTFSPGIEVYTFQGNINLTSLPASCCYVSVGFNTCCRNAAITTLAGPSGLNFYTEAIINRCATPCNAAPTFTNDPVAVVCAGQDFTYNLGAIDPDGDSLSYAYGQSLTNPGASAPYVSPYSPTVPFPYLGAPLQSPPALPPLGISIDPVSGDIRFRPAGNFVSMLVIEVKQWKTIGGVPTLMGVTRRDIQFYSQFCPPNNPPILRTYDANGVLTSPQPLYTYYICAGQQLCLFVTAWDETAGWDTTDMSWNSPAPLVSNGATFVKAYNVANRGLVGPKKDSMKFCWTPPASMAQSMPWYFVVTAKDRACPVPARTAHSFAIYVRRIPLATINKINKNCGYYDFSYTLLNGSQVTTDPTYTQFQVENGPRSGFYTVYNASTVTNHHFLTAGWYRVKLRLSTIPPPNPSGCPNNNIIDSVYIPDPVKVTVRDTFNCLNVPLTFQSHGTAGVPFGNGYRYIYYSGLMNSTTIIRLLNADSNVVLNPSVPNITSNYKVVIQDLNGCRDSAAIHLFTRPLPLHQMAPSMRLCYGTSDTLNAGNSLSSINTWRWYKSPISPVLSDTISQKIVPGDSGRYVVKKIDNFGCINFDTAMVYVNPQVPVSAGPNRTICFNDPPINIVASGTTAAIDSFQWRQIPISDPTIVLARSATLSISPPANTSFQVTGFITYGGITCSYVDTMDVVVKSLPVITRPGNFSLCRNTQVVLLPNIVSTNKPGQISQLWSYPQNPSAIVGNQVKVDSLKNLPGAPPANPAGNVMKLTITDSDGCIIRDSLIIALFPVPTINAGPRRRFCDYASVFNITPGTQLYSPNGGALANNELWTGNGIYKPNASQNYYAFNPKGTGVKNLPDTNIITYNFTATFPLINPVTFVPAVSGITAPSPTGGCVAWDTVLFDVILTPTLKAGIAPAVCKSGDSVYLNAWMINRTTTTDTFKSYWYMPAVDAIYRPALSRNKIFVPKHSVIPNITKTYSLVYADTSTTCRVADTTMIQVNANPDVNIDYLTPLDSAVCKTKGTVFFYLDPSGTDPADGSLTSSPPLPASAFNVTTGKFDLTNTTNGVYNVKYYFNDPATHCDNRDSINIRIQEPPQLAITDDGSVCSYGAMFTVGFKTTPLFPYTVLWTTLDGNGTIQNNGTAGISYSATAADISRGTITFRAQVMDTSVCNSLTDEATYIIKPKPLSQFVASPNKGCVNSRIGQVLSPVYTSAPTGVAGSTYKWFDNDPNLVTQLNANPATDAVFTQTFTQPGVHVVALMVEANGCSDTSLEVVEAYETPVASFVSDPKSTTIARPFFDFTNTSTTVKDDPATLTYTWTLPANPKGGPQRLFYDKNLARIPFAADTGWSTVKLIVVSIHGCTDSTEDYVKIEPDITVFIPNVFRPGDPNNGGSTVDCPNGCNRTFKVSATGYESIEIFVFNRWGQMVFKTNDPNDGWNGKDFNTGKDCQQDAYIYQINAISFNSKKYTYSGSITLLR